MTIDAERFARILRKAYGLKFDEAMYSIIMECEKEVSIHRIRSQMFEHDFAKAFWGDMKENGSVICGNNTRMTFYDKESGWQYHLQQLVLEEDPLTYLEKFL